MKWFPAFGTAFNYQTAVSKRVWLVMHLKSLTAHNTLCRRWCIVYIWKRGKSVIRRWQGKQIEVSLLDKSGPQGKEVDSFYKAVIDLNNSTLHLMGCVIWRYPCGIHNPSLICQVWHRGTHHYLCDLWRISLKGQFVIHKRPRFGTSIDLCLLSGRGLERKERIGMMDVCREKVLGCQKKAKIYSF